MDRPRMLRPHRRPIRILPDSHDRNISPSKHDSPLRILWGAYDGQGQGRWITVGLLSRRTGLHLEAPSVQDRVRSIQISCVRYPDPGRVLDLETESVIETTGGAVSVAPTKFAKPGELVPIAGGVRHPRSLCNRVWNELTALRCTCLGQMCVSIKSPILLAGKRGLAGVDVYYVQYVPKGEKYPPA